MLKEGSKVRIIEDLEDRRDESVAVSIEDEMLAYVGLEAEIMSDECDGTYCIDIDDGEWYWEEWMFVVIEN